VAASFSLTGTLRLDPRWVDDLNTTLVTDATRVNLSLSLTNGDGDGEADCYWRDVRTLAGGEQDAIYLSALPLSVFGGTGTLDMSALRFVYVRNLSETVALRYGIDGGDGRIGISPGGVLLWSAPADVLFPLSDSLSEIAIHNLGSSAADYEILLIGVKA
jgi:hypothetical protein